MKNILVVGGAGYIGSHQTRYLLDKGFKVVVFDNLSRGHREFVDKRATFFQGDLLSKDDVHYVFLNHHFDAVMHFAAFALVGESVKQPGTYYDNNITGVLNLLHAMNEFGVKKIIFSSSAAVYGEPSRIPISEYDELKPINPYGWTKRMTEQILKDFDIAHGIKSVSLRYFNAAGAAYGLGELHKPETHLIPNVLLAALTGKAVEMLGSDYPTPDGTCVRDYIHVLDLVRAHHLALEFLFNHNETRSYNLGSGTGYSVKKVIEMCKEVTGIDIPVKISPRRPGDPAILVASSEKIAKELSWKPELSLKKIISSAWEWRNNEKIIIT